MHHSHGTRSGRVDNRQRSRKNLFPLIEKVNEDHAPVHITSRKGNAVLLSEEDFASWQETIYLMRSPANARRLLDSIAEAEAGDVAYHELIDAEDTGDGE